MMSNNSDMTGGGVQLTLAPMRKLSAVLLLLAGLAACAVDPHKVADHTIYADEEERLTHDGALRFAVVGNLREKVPVQDALAKRAAHDGVTEALVNDLRDNVDRKGLDFVALMGDSVRWSDTKTWKGFDLLWREVLDGESIPTTEGYRIPAMPVAGDHEYLGDNKLTAMEGAFPGVGVDIGYARVASWYHFDVRVEDTIWRFVVLDSNKKKLGSRWNEQLYWLPRACEGKYHNMVIFMHHPVVTLAGESDKDGAPSELLETIEDNINPAKIKAIFSGDPSSSEVLLPSGNLGAAMFTAGGGGAPADLTERWGNRVDLGYGDVQLEPLYDLKLQSRFDEAAEAQGFPEGVIDRAKGSGSWEGFTAAYDPKYFPLYGWFKVEITGEDLNVTFQSYDGEGFDTIYRIDLEEDRWRAGS